MRSCAQRRKLLSQDNFRRKRDPLCTTWDQLYVRRLRHCRSVTVSRSPVQDGLQEACSLEAPNSSTGATRRFDGAGEDAARRHWKWRKWAKAYLTLLEAKGTPKEAHGGALFCLLDGPAELALEGIRIDDLCVANGADRVFCASMNDSWTLRRTTRGESLDNVFRLRVDRNGRTAAYTGRCRELFDELPTFESTGDVSEDYDPEVLHLPAEQYPVTGGPRTLLQRRQATQLRAITERILEVRASASCSDITVASFADSSLDLTEIAGRHGIEIADHVSCAAGWNPLSSSGRRRFWHVHFTLAPKLVIYSLPVAVQQWLSASNPSKVALHPRFKSVRDQLQLYVKGMRWQPPYFREHGHW